MSGKVRVLVPAKINMYLGVGPRRSDGYHDLATVYHAIDLYDEITVTSLGDGHPSGVTVTIEGEGATELPLDRDNLAVQAVYALAEVVGVEPRVSMHLRKRIPVAGGLAGGSADGAAALLACDTLWGSGLSRAKLAALAADLGSDVPFALYGYTAVGRGRGELIEPLPDNGHTWHWVVALADGGLSTPAVYAELDRLREDGSAPPPHDEIDNLLAAIRQDDPWVLGDALCNEMQVAAVSLRPALRLTLEAGLAAGAVAGLVSGSGPTCVFLASNGEEATMIAHRLRGTPGCRKVLTARGSVAGARVMVETATKG